jgi:hypothetical protein
MAEEQIAREGNLIAYLAAEKVVSRHAEKLSDDVDASEFDRGMELRAIL